MILIHISILLNFEQEEYKRTDSYILNEISHSRSQMEALLRIPLQNAWPLIYEGYITRVPFIAGLYWGLY